MEYRHNSVMLDEVVETLSPGENKVIFDGTAGGGGHTAALAQKAGQVIAVDKDPDAVENLKRRFNEQENVCVINDDFVHIKDILKNLSLDKVDGILLDLGVSSYQLDNSERGFSYQKDMPLDMRMSKKGLSAANVVNEYSEENLKRIILEYGEERYAGSIAKNIVRARNEKPIETTFELVDIIRKSMPASELRKKHPARRTFQAIRIEVNNELETLKEALGNCFEALNKGGILVILTFHSLEDRIVKEQFAEWIQGCTCPKEFPVCICNNRPKGELPFKFKKPSEEEKEKNPRSRSAIMRAFIKY